MRPTVDAFSEKTEESWLKYILVNWFILVHSFTCMEGMVWPITNSCCLAWIGAVQTVQHKGTWLISIARRTQNYSISCCATFILVSVYLLKRGAKSQLCSSGSRLFLKRVSSRLLVLAYTILKQVRFGNWRTILGIRICKAFARMEMIIHQKWYAVQSHHFLAV